MSTRPLADPLHAGKSQLRFAHAFMLPCLGLAAVFLFTAAGIAQTPLPEELIVPRSQPAVFVVFACGDGEVTFPKNVTVKRAALQAEYSTQHAEGEKEAAFYWRRISENPGSYLTRSPESEKRRFTDEPYARGTAFAISRNGILLTNAHVIAGPDNVVLDGIMDGIAGPAFVQLCTDLVLTFGKPLTDKETLRAVQALAGWYMPLCSVTGKFTRAKIALGFGVDPKKGGLHNIYDPFMKREPIPRPADEPILRSTNVAAVGEPFPGKDVAVLRIVMDDSVKGDPFRDSSLDLFQNDRLICLPLGDSDAVLPGAKIHALGFPGKAFDPGVMGPDAKFRVSSRTGEIGQTKRTIGNWNAFEMSAEVGHGDSGGPVIDSRGNVIGITVWGDFPGHKLAVPINVAKELLRKAHIDHDDLSSLGRDTFIPDPGPLSQLWEEGLRLYGEGKYAEASAKFKEVRNRQLNGDNEKSPPLMRLLRTSKPDFVSPYVDEMLGRCANQPGTHAP